MQFFPPIGEPVPSSHQLKHLMRFLCSIAFIFFLQCLHFFGIVVVHQAIQKSMVIIETLSLSLICLPHSSSAKIFGQCCYNTLKVSDVKTIHRNWKLCCCFFPTLPWNCSTNTLPEGICIFKGKSFWQSIRKHLLGPEVYKNTSRSFLLLDKDLIRYWDQQKGHSIITRTKHFYIAAFV